MPFSSIHPRTALNSLIILCMLLSSFALPASQVKPVFADAPTPLPNHLQLVKDINPADQVEVLSDFFAFNGYLYFSGYEETHSIELFRCKLESTGCGAHELVHDIAPGSNSSNPNGFTVMNNNIYFFADNGTVGRELWRSDGVPGGQTELVKDIYPGSAGQDPYTVRQLALVTYSFQGQPFSYLYFAANDGVHGTELWRTDGSDAGTVLVKDLFPGPGGSTPASLTPYGGQTVYFAATHSTMGRVLWRSDGTDAGTAPLSYLDSNQLGLIPGRLFVMPGSQPLLIFTANHAQTGTELYYSNLSGSTGLLKDIFPGVNSSHPNQFTLMGGKLYFIAQDGAYGYQIWCFDGLATVSRVTEINVPAPNTPNNYGISLLGTVKNGTPEKEWLFFSAYLPETGTELWKTDGQTTALVNDIFPGAGSSYPQGMVSLGGKVYFRADDGVHGSELWVSDGQPAGTLLVKDVLPGSESGKPIHLFASDSRLYFSSEVMTFDNFLWSSDGTQAGTQPVNHKTSGNASSNIYYGMVPLGNKMVFPAKTTDEGHELWISDGSLAGTQLLKDILPGSASAYPKELVALNGMVLFTAYHPASGYELWSTDGTPGGTQLLKDLLPGMKSAYPKHLTRVPGMAEGVGPERSLVFFITQDGDYQVSLWKTDGTPAGTQRIEHGPNQFTRIDRLAAGQGQLFLVACDTMTKLPYSAAPYPVDVELWQSDGLTVSRVKDINPGESGTQIYTMLFGNGWLYFGADDGTHGIELWKSNGTEAGTQMVKDIHPNGASSSIDLLGVNGKTVFFKADDGEHGFELWKTDGTPAGTQLVRDINPGSDESSPEYLLPVGNLVYFIADDGVHGKELWKSDGSPAGTRLVKDINPGPDNSYLDLATAVGSTLFFAAYDPAHGTELWTSGGSENSTFLLADLEPGPKSSWPAGFQVLENRVFFTACVSPYACELWTMEVPQKVFLPLVTK